MTALARTTRPLPKIGSAMAWRRSTQAGGLVGRAGTSGLQLLEQGRLERLGAYPTRRGDQRPYLAAANEPLAAELDALELAGSRPGADRRRPEVDVGRGQDLGRFRERDPVACCWRHSVSRPGRPTERVSPRAARLTPFRWRPCPCPALRSSRPV